MRLIIKIGRAELRTLFYSPIAWVIAVAFFIVCGVEFAGPLESLASMQQFYQDNKPGWSGFQGSLTSDLFNGSYAYLLKNLYLFIPLLTMGVISRDVQSGAVHLLNSSPVTIRQIVLGKYLGLIAYNAVIMVPIALLMGVGYFSIVNAEYKVFLSVLTGVYLLACTYSAIGLFISSCTNYQVVAAMLTFLVFGILGVISFLWQQYDFVRDLTYFLHISGRVDNLVNGLITTKDLCYFILICTLFLSFTQVKCRNKRESRPWYVFFSRYVVVLVVVLLLGYASSRPAYTGYLDVTRRQVNTIHPATLQSLRELDGSPLQVTLYVNLLDDSFEAGQPANRNNYVWGVWGKYIRFYPNIQFNYVYYYDVRDGDSVFFKRFRNMSVEQVAQKAIKFYGMRPSMFKKPEQIRRMVDLNPEGMRLVMELEYKSKKTFLRTYRDPQVWPAEMHFSAAFKRLARPSVPLVLFTTGHYERSPFKTGEREYAFHTHHKGSRSALLNQGLDVDTISLENKDIPANTSILVVADPRMEFSDKEKAAIKTYLDNGGDAIFYAEPGKQPITNALLQTIGVRLNDGIVVHTTQQEMPDIIHNDMTDRGARMALEPAMFHYQQSKVPHLGTRLFGHTNIQFNQLKGFHIEPIFTLDGGEGTWIENGLYVADSAAPVFLSTEGDIKMDNYVSGIKMTRTIHNREQRIVVTGDSDFMSRLRGSGGVFGNAAYSWLVHNDFPVYTNYPFPTDNLLKVSRNASQRIWTLFVYVIPAIVMALGFIILIRRKRK